MKQNSQAWRNVIHEKIVAKIVKHGKNSQAWQVAAKVKCYSWKNYDEI